jgi:hypothetical protein
VVRAIAASKDVELSDVVEMLRTIANDESADEKDREKSKQALEAASRAMAFSIFAARSRPGRRKPFSSMLRNDGVTPIAAANALRQTARPPMATRSRWAPSVCQGLTR